MKCGLPQAYLTARWLPVVTLPSEETRSDGKQVGCPYISVPHFHLIQPFCRQISLLGTQSGSKSVPPLGYSASGYYLWRTHSNLEDLLSFVEQLKRLYGTRDSSDPLVLGYSKILLVDWMKGTSACPCSQNLMGLVTEMSWYQRVNDPPGTRLGST